MNSRKILIDVMLRGLGSQIRLLSDLRLEMFLEWLLAHCHLVFENTGPEKSSPVELAHLETERLQEYLSSMLGNWLESLPLPGLLWEYHLILNEVGYWLDLDPRQLARILETERQA